MTDPDQVLDVIRDVIVDMDTDDFGPWFRPQSVVKVGRYSGTPESANPSLHGEPEPMALLLTMRDGSAWRLTLDAADSLDG